MLVLSRPLYHCPPTSVPPYPLPPTPCTPTPRGIRSANVLVASMDPVSVLLADLGVAHLLSAFVSGVDTSASKVCSVLTGEAADGPFLWAAPEVGAVAQWGL